MPIISRGLAAAALAVGLTGALAAPSAASAPELDLFFPDVIIAPNSAGTIGYAIAFASEPIELEDVSIKIDLAGANGLVTIAPNPPAPCGLNGSVLTCGDGGELLLDPSAIASPKLAIKPTASATEGATGKLKVTLSAKNISPVSTESSITVGEGIDLAAGPKQDFTAEPGAALPYTLEVGNVGTKAANGAGVFFYNDYGFATDKTYSNCYYSEGMVTACRFDEQLAAGGKYATAEKLGLKLRTDTLAPDEHTGSQVQWVSAAEFDQLVGELDDKWLGEPGAGEKLRLVAKPAMRSLPQVDINGTNDWTQINVNVTGNNPVDYAVSGGSASGSVNQVVTVTVGMKNVGTGTPDYGGVLGPAGSLNIKLPAGSSLAEMPDDCRAMREDGSELDEEDQGDLTPALLRCENPSTVLVVGHKVEFPLKLRIDQVVTSATGSVALVTDGCDSCLPDASAANDNATIVLNAPGLPITGVQVGLLAGVGALLAVAGVSVFLMGRRRRLVA